MILLTRILAACALVGALALGCSFALWTTFAPTDETLSLSKMFSQIIAESVRYDELDHQDRVVYQRIEAKFEVVEGLLDGDITLDEAIDRFEAMHEDEYHDVTDLDAERDSDEAVTAIRVLSWAQTQAHHRPGGEELYEAIEAEFHCSPYWHGDRENR